MVQKNMKKARISIFVVYWDKIYFDIFCRKFKLIFQEFQNFIKILVFWRSLHMTIFNIINRFMVRMVCLEKMICQRYMHLLVPVRYILLYHIIIMIRDVDWFILLHIYIYFLYRMWPAPRTSKTPAAHRRNARFVLWPIRPCVKMMKTKIEEHQIYHEFFSHFSMIHSFITNIDENSLKSNFLLVTI